MCQYFIVINRCCTHQRLYIYAHSTSTSPLRSSINDSISKVVHLTTRYGSSSSNSITASKPTKQEEVDESLVSLMSNSNNHQRMEGPIPINVPSETRQTPKWIPSALQLKLYNQRKVGS